MLRPLRNNHLETLPPIVVLIVLFFAWGGCGMRDWDEDLPNGYALHSPWEGMICISRPDRILVLGDEGSSIDLIEIRGDLVFGAQENGERFVLDTRSHALSTFRTEQEWLSHLAGVGVTDPDPSVPGPAWQFLPCAGFLLCVIAVPATMLWYLIRANRGSGRPPPVQKP